MLNNVSRVNTTAFSREFTGVLKENAGRVTINLSKSKEGVLNELAIKAQNGEAYNYACKKGLDMEFFKSKMASVCEHIQEGKKLFKEIMEYGLKLK